MSSDTQVSQDLVTVVVPAFNAAATIDETLVSVRAQTHTNLEIVIVDDGSTDATPAIAAGHAAVDPRVRLVKQSNGGVARARNRGIAEASGRFVAPVDGDDLWAPQKIAKQLARLKQTPSAGLVYTWYAVIDERSHLVDTSFVPSAEGNVLADLCGGNFVGNGSSPLMLKNAVEEAGGYDASLRDRRAQGCEDYLLYLRIAERRHFALVPEFLTGYRQTQMNMSSDSLQMLRSWDMVVEETLSRHPQFRNEIRRGEFWFLWWLFRRACVAGRFRPASRLFARMAPRHPRSTLAALTNPTLLWPRRSGDPIVPWSLFAATERTHIETRGTPLSAPETRPTGAVLSADASSA